VGLRLFGLTLLFAFHLARRLAHLLVLVLLLMPL
jgi:hypothetical protein